MTDAETTERSDELADEENGTDSAPTTEGDDLEERLVAEGEIAGDYLEELLDLLDFDGDIDLDVEQRDDVTARPAPRADVPLAAQRHVLPGRDAGWHRLDVTRLEGGDLPPDLPELAAALKGLRHGA